MKSMILVPALALALIGASGIAQAMEWNCSLLWSDQEVILTQQGKPEKAKSGEVKGTVTGPYGRKHDAIVSIDGFDRRWDYVDRDGNYSVIMQPSGLVGFYDFTGVKEGELRESSYDLFCEESVTEAEHHQTEEERRLAHFPEEEMTLIADKYIHAIRQKVERNWIKPMGSEYMPLCKVHVIQGPGGIILGVDFGACDGSTATYRASIENAIYKAEPLPAPEDPELFERELNFYFDPGISSTRIRSADGIEQVFQRNKGGLFNVYNRALRKNPSLAGQLVVELTISPDGEVTAAKVLSSELGDDAVEQKIIMKIMKFNFSKEEVPEITITYPIDFLPS